jgi:hypothetical protein
MEKVRFLIERILLRTIGWPADRGSGADPGAPEVNYFRTALRGMAAKEG